MIVCQYRMKSTVIFPEVILIDEEIEPLDHLFTGIFIHFRFR